VGRYSIPVNLKVVAVKTIASVEEKKDQPKRR